MVYHQPHDISFSKVMKSTLLRIDPPTSPLISKCENWKFLPNIGINMHNEMVNIFCQNIKSILSGTEIPYCISCPTIIFLVIVEAEYFQARFFLTFNHIIGKCYFPNKSSIKWTLKKGLYSGFYGMLIQ